MTAAADLDPDGIGPYGDGQVDAAGRRALRLEYATVAWNVLEVVVTILAGVAARSLGLVAFGLDSLVEVTASVVVIVHTRTAHTGSDDRLRRSLRMIAGCFVVLGGWLVAGAAVALASRHAASPSPWMTAFMLTTALVMVGLALAKRKVGRESGNRPLLANASMTLLDGFVALGVCLALVADVALGWWWADAVVAALVGLVAIREGRSGWAEAAR